MRPLHFVSTPTGSVYSCVCDIDEDHGIDAWVTCAGCRTGIDRGDIRESGPHTFTEGCYFSGAAIAIEAD